MDFELRILKANHGDAIIISGRFDGEQRHILIDGGPAQTFEVQSRPQALQLFLNDISSKEQKIDLLVLTHVDDDHIGGLISGFKKTGYLTELTQEVWFNSGKLIFQHNNKPTDDSNLVMLRDSVGNNTSIGQGVTLESHLENMGIWTHSLIKAGDELERFGCKFIMLSPSMEKLNKLLKKWKKERPLSLTSSGETDYRQSLSQLLADDQFKEDTSKHNGSSLAFIFQYQQKSILFLGDAHPSVIVDSLLALGYSKENPLKLEYLKVSHHGSKANTNDELLSLLDCDHFIISTDGSRHNLPNKRTFARIVQHFPNATLMFNYEDLIARIFSAEELSAGSFTAVGCKDVISL